MQSTYEEAEILGVAHVFASVTSSVRSGAGSGFGLMHGHVQDAPWGALCWH